MTGYYAIFLPEKNDCGSAAGTLAMIHRKICRVQDVQLHKFNVFYGATLNHLWKAILMVWIGKLVGLYA